MNAPVKKLLSLNQLALALAERLPHKPDHRKMMRALDLGMPTVPSRMLGGSNRMRYLFDLEAVIAWWFPEEAPAAGPPRAKAPDRSAIDAAIEAKASRRLRTA